MNPEQKYARLLRILEQTKGCVLAFSGGVDSSLLAAAAKTALSDNFLAVTVSTPYTMNWEVQEAGCLAKKLGIRHRQEQMPFPEEIRNNPPDHCYTCKKILFARMLEIAREHGFVQVVEGTNVDDLSDFRPGIRALHELEIQSPLVQAGLNKAEIREQSEKLGLPTWNKPSFACLLSRLPCDTPISDRDLEMVEVAEVFLMDLGFKAVRVRKHWDVARIEVPMERISDLASAALGPQIHRKLKDMGFKHVAVDLAGYRTGSQNPERNNDE